MSQVKVACFLSEKDVLKVSKGYLRILNNDREIEVDFSDDIIIGDETGNSLKNLVEKADITVLFLSVDIYETEFYKNYIAEILDRNHLGLTEIIVVHLRKTPIFETSEFYNLTFFPSRDDPIIKAENQLFEEQWERLSSKIRETALSVKRKNEIKPNYTFVANLCNREEQARQLENALKRQAETSKRNPLVCFVHGSPEQNLDDYQERIEKSELKVLLKTNEIKCFPEIRWTSKSYDLSDVTKYLREDLILRLKRDRKIGEMIHEIEENAIDNETKIADRLRAYPMPVMFSYRMETAHWKPVEINGNIKQPSEIIRDFLEFWNRIAAFDFENQIIVCLFFVYKNAANPIYKEDYENFNKNARKFFNFSEDNSKIFTLPRAWFPNIGIHYDEKFDNLCGVILNELPSVNLEEVSEWLEFEETFQDFCPRHQNIFCDTRAVIKSLEDYYGDPSLEYVDFHPVIPMERLTKILTSEFGKHRCRF